MPGIRVAMGVVSAFAATWLAGTVLAPAQEPTEPISPYAARFIELFDINHDGKVTLDEINGDQARLFGAVDVNSDKKLSVAEVRRRGRFLQMWRTTTVFDLVDVNGDGVLTLDEIDAPTSRWFKRYDRNGDGVLDVTELPQRRSWEIQKQH